MSGNDLDREIEELTGQLERLKAKKAARESSAPTFDAEEPIIRGDARRRKPKNSGLQQYLWIGGGAVLILAMAAMCTKPSVEITEPATSSPYAPEYKALDLPPPTSWSYRSRKDEMTDKQTEFACTTSTTQVRLDWPYSDVSADLCIRQSPQHGLDVYLQLNGEGQILCRSYDGCTVSIRFGDKAPQGFSATGASDNSSNIIFVSNASRFVQNVKGAETTKIQIELYQAGSQVVEFDTKDLVWPRPTTE